MYKKKLQNKAASVLFISFLFTFTGHASSLLFTIGVTPPFLTATFPAYFLFSVSHYMRIHRSGMHLVPQSALAELAIISPSTCRHQC